MPHLSDTLGRRTRLCPSPTGQRVTPTARDLAWFALLAEHGPLPSSFLLSATATLGRSEKRARERLTTLFHENNTPDDAPYLTRPPQQFRTLDARYNQLVYDLSPAAIRALEREQAMSSQRPVPSGPWLHRHMTACITASIDLATRTRTDVSYIPQSAILERANVELRCPVTIIDPVTKRQSVKDLIPDAVFGLHYHTDAGSRFRFFAVEADRATEPVTSPNWNRKSFDRSVLHYEAYVAGGVYRRHLGLSAPLMVLHIVSDQKRTERMIDHVTRRYPAGNSFMLFQTWDAFGPVFRPPEPSPALLIGGWVRGGLTVFNIGEP